MNPKYSKYYTFVKPILNNKAVKSYSFLIFSLITSTIMIIFAIQPTVKTIVALQKSIDEQKTILKKAQKKISDLDQGDKNYQALPEGVKTNLLSLVPSTPLTDKPTTSTPPLSKFIGDLSGLIALNNLNLTGLQFQETELIIQPPSPGIKPELKTVDFTLNIQGDYTRLVNFLNTLGKINHLVSITSVSFSKPSDNPLLLSINGKVYYLKNN